MIKNQCPIVFDNYGFFDKSKIFPFGYCGPLPIKEATREVCQKHCLLIPVMFRQSLALFGPRCGNIVLHQKFG